MLMRNVEWQVERHAPCSAGEIVTAVIAGVTPCKINVDSEVLPVNFVSLGSNQLVPSYGRGDALVLWRAGGLGLQWAILRIGQVATEHHLFTLTSDMDSGTGQATIRDMDDSFTIEEDAPVLDPLGIFAELTEGARGICVLQLGKYYIIQAECE